MFTVDPNTGIIASETDTCRELVPNQSDRQEIADIVVNEFKGNKYAKGTDCD